MSAVRRPGRSAAPLSWLYESPDGLADTPVTRVVVHPDAQEFQLTTVLHALGDPVRLGIVQTLGAGPEMPCGRFEVSVCKSTLTHHLSVLRRAGLTYTRIEGVQRMVSLRRDELERRFPGLMACVLGDASAPPPSENGL
ncbi:MAG: ArsR/SmtB family transcription factor [Solirubrobacteraceae bacterium]